MKNKIKFGALFVALFTSNAFGMEFYKEGQNYSCAGHLRTNTQSTELQNKRLDKLKKHFNALIGNFSNLFNKNDDSDETLESFGNIVTHLISNADFSESDLDAEEYLELLSQLTRKLQIFKERGSNDEMSPEKVVYYFVQNFIEMEHPNYPKGKSGALCVFRTAVDLVIGEMNHSATGPDEIFNFLERITTFLVELQRSQPLLIFTDRYYTTLPENFAKHCALEIINEFVNETDQEQLGAFYHENFRTAAKMNPCELMLLLADIQSKLYSSNSRPTEEEIEANKEALQSFVKKLKKLCLDEYGNSYNVDHRGALLKLHTSAFQTYVKTMSGIEVQNSTLLDVLMCNIKTVIISQIIKEYGCETSPELLKSILFGSADTPVSQTDIFLGFCEDSEDPLSSPDEDEAVRQTIKSILETHKEEILPKALSDSYELLGNILVDSTEEFLGFINGKGIDPTALFGFNTEILTYSEGSQQCLDFALYWLNEREKIDEILNKINAISTNKESEKIFSEKLKGLTFCNMMDLLKKSSQSFANTLKKDVFDQAVAFLNIIDENPLVLTVESANKETPFLFDEEIEMQSQLYKKFKEAHDNFEEIRSNKIRSNDEDFKKSVEQLQSTLEDLIEDPGLDLDGDCVTFFSDHIIKEKAVPSYFISLIKMLYDIGEETSIDVISDLPNLSTIFINILEPMLSSDASTEKEDLFSGLSTSVQTTLRPLQVDIKKMSAQKEDPFSGLSTSVQTTLRPLQVDIKKMSAQEAVKEILYKRSHKQKLLLGKFLVYYFQILADVQNAKPFWVDEAQMPDYEDND